MSSNGTYSCFENAELCYAIENGSGRPDRVPPRVPQSVQVESYPVKLSKSGLPDSIERVNEKIGGFFAEQTTEHSCYAATLETGRPGILHGAHSYVLQDVHGQIAGTHSVSAGLDYPGVGPEHSYLASIGRAEYPCVTDAEVIDAFQMMARSEGIIPALECAHALAWIVREAPTMQGQVVLMNLSGRGDKDVNQMMEILG